MSVVRFVTILMQVVTACRASFELAGRNRGIDIDFNNLTGLSCFQCKSNVREPYPLCDTLYFPGTNKKTKTDALMQCHAEMKFCVKRVERGPKGLRVTERGCGYAHDAGWYAMRPGCMIGDNVEVCICRTNLCNHAAVTMASSALPLGVIYLFGLQHTVACG